MTLDAPVSVLVLGGDPEGAERTRRGLERTRSSFAVETTTDVGTAVAAVADADSAIDCVVSDYRLGETTGVEACERVRDRWPDLPFVVFARDGSEAAASRAFAAGASDCLPRTGDGDRFAAAAERIEAAVTHHRATRPEREYRTVFDRMADAFFALDTDWRLTFVNDHARAVLADAMGRDPDDLLGRLFWEEIPEAVGTTFDEQYREAMATQSPVAYEAYYEPLESWFEVRAYPSETGLSVYFSDVTDRHRQRATVESRERTLREMHDVIARRDDSFADKVESLLELGREELGIEYGTLSQIRGDEYVFEVVAGEDDLVSEGDVVPVAATNCEVTATRERTVVRSDIARQAPDLAAREGYTEMGIESYLGAPVVVSDEVYGTFCFYGTDPRTDPFSEWEVTLTDLMSRWVGYELHRRESEERLRRQNEKLGRFASIVSHDLRNPLNVAQGHLELLGEDRDSEHVEAVRRAHDRMEALIRDLLTVAHSGDEVRHVEPVDLASLARRSWRGVETHGATVRVAAEGAVRADERRLRQLLENLIRNSVEHSPTRNRTDSGDSVEGDFERGRGDSDSDAPAEPAETSSPEVSVVVGDLPDGFFVADDGPGIPPADRAAVFESGHSSKADGTGLGLAIVREIAEAHSWTVSVTESASGGARFEFTGVERE